MSEAQTDAPAPPPPVTFDAMPLGAEVRRAIDAMGYKSPTPVQRAVFEPAARGKSLVVQARTGTGKTAAFGLPILDQLVKKSLAKPQALILTPTRELALQVAHELEQLGQFRGIKVTAVYGGAPMGRQVEALAGGAQVVVGTPGRVLDHLRRGTFDASSVRIFVLDEADEMLSMGFAKELHAIVELLPRERQGLFFSATIPPDIERLAIAQLKEPEFITLSSDQIGALEIGHFVYLLPPGADKRQELVRILEVEDPESAIVFCNTKDETERICEALQNRGYDAEWLNGDLEQKERERIMQRTREGKLRFLVATDVAARGIDISHLTHVVNADFPESAEQYVHRTGRTGRAGRTGTAISLVGPKGIGGLYLLRLTYKIRPIEKQLPSRGEMKTRAEQDIVQLFVDAFAGRTPHPDDLSLARRMLTHADAERILAGLLRDHLGARAGDPATEAAEARRAKNPPAMGSDPIEARAPREPRGRDRGDRGGDRDRGPRDRGPRGMDRDARPADARPMDRDARPADARPMDRDARPADARPMDRDARPREGRRHEREPATGEPRGVTGRETRPSERGDARPADRDARPAARTEPSAEATRPAGEARPRERDTGRRRGGVPHASYTGWEPPAEMDDDAPILKGGIPAPEPIGYRVEGDDEPTHVDLGADFAEMFVNVGRREAVRGEDLQQLLGDGGIPAGDVGRIRVRDRMTFVTVRREVVERAIAALAGKVIGGRTVVAELAKGGGAGAGRPRAH